MDADSLPEVPLKLLEALEGLYPEEPIDPDMTIESIMHYGGQRALIMWLREVHTAQTSPPEVEPDVDQE